MRFVALLLLLAACTSVETRDLDPGDEYARTDPDDVRIYRWAEDVPPGRYEPIALFGWRMDRSLWDRGDLEALRRRAAKIGADAVILGDPHPATRGSAWNLALVPVIVLTGSSGGGNGIEVEQVAGTGVAIRFVP